MILLIDHYDGFSYNLYQLVKKIHSDVSIVRSDQITIEEIRQMKPQMIFLSSGGGKPEEDSLLVQTVKTFGKGIPIFGAGTGCLAVCRAFGAELVHAKRQVYGETVEIVVNTQSRMFREIEKPCMKAGGYYSLTADETRLPDCLRVTAKNRDNDIMAVEHKEYPVYGVQFQPESILTQDGRKLIEYILKEEVFSKMASSRILSKIKEILKERQSEEEM